MRELGFRELVFVCVCVMHRVHLEARGHVKPVEARGQTSLSILRNCPLFVLRQGLSLARNSLSSETQDLPPTVSSSPVLTSADYTQMP